MTRSLGIGTPLALALVAALVPGLAAQGPARGGETADETAVCASCHTRARIDPARTPPHGGAVTCLECHHIDYSNDPDVVAARRLEACEACHAAVPATHSGPTPAATCTDCHTIHADPDVAGPELVGPGACESCHEGHTLHADVADAPGCTSCHTVHAEGPLAAGVEQQCGSCHEAVHPAHAGVEGGLPCLDCHGVDADPTVAENEMALTGACQTCHEGIPPTHVVEGESILLCGDCHDFAERTGSVTGSALSGECGSCHGDVVDAMLAGGHADGVAGDPNPDLPTCTTCHTAHVEPASRAADVRLSATIRCIECHSQGSRIEEYQLPANAAESYVEDYHGATVKFLWNHPAGESQPNVLVCSDCHGAHAVGWDPGTAVADVCLECHERGDEKLAGAWLGHGEVGPGNQVAVWLVRIFYYVLIPFVLVGLFLNIVLHLWHEWKHGTRMANAPKMSRLRAWLAGRQQEKPATVPRFTLRERIEHMAAATTFILLVVTGLPQTDPDSPLANATIDLFGGIASTRLLHRIVGFTFVALLVVHVARGVMAALRRHELPEIMPRKRDFHALLQTVRHYLRGEPKPKVGKFDAAAKFEYWGLFFGGLIMTVTGVVLVFPEAVTTILPGVVVSVMRTVHGLEATFAVLVVLLWHSWSVIFRPDIFPLDTSMFTGEIEVDRLREEHALEYERLVAAGEAPDID